ncbi:MAG: DUF362 domain-containing protein, partial [Planctomycetes bacterium]|nr:DUF362 domain-containing protein [Planctomycetota bacterium]
PGGIPMTQLRCPHAGTQRREQRHRSQGPGLHCGFLWNWFLANSLVSGFLALCWLVLRSGPKPSRVAYPCQQAALSAATLAFGAPVVGAVIALRRRVVAGLRTPWGIAVAALGLSATAGLWGYASWAAESRGPRRDPPRDYRAQVYHVSDCPQDPAGDHFVGVNNLIALMGREGLKFYDSETESLAAGPEGIIGVDDVVVVKINYQWAERGGTNTDVLRGLIRRIVDHPDGFTGEVIVCENAQFNSTSGLDRSSNNAQDHSLSPHDVVVGFQTLGYNVSHYDWTLVRGTSVAEYSMGDMADGYVVYDYDSQFGGRLSYPKFQADSGTYVSLKHGIWDPMGPSYSRERLKFINIPVLKSHSATYGATACIKHYMGVVTGSLSTNSHGAIANGILGALLGEIQLADLNILDSIWINANPYSGPSTSYSGATRRDELVASVDPVAVDIWAVKNILIPAFVDNGYSPPWPHPSADPDDANSEFREYLDNSMSFILAAGYDVTNDPDQIDVRDGNGATGDFDGDSDVDGDDYLDFATCFTGAGGILAPGCEAGDFDSDSDVDCDDWSHFELVWTDSDNPPPLAECDDISPQPAPPPHDTRKNRYVSFDPNNGGALVAYRLAMTASDFFPESTGVLGWIDEPDENGIARVVASPHYSDAWPAVVHAGDCEVSPAATFEVSLTADGTTFSSPLVVATTPQPPPAKWGDCVGAMEGGVWTAPNGVVNFDDITAAVQYFTSAPTAPHLTWIDLDDEVPNKVINFADIMQIVLAFQGTDYPFVAPGSCP